jgi:hypothetical protein
VVWCGVAWYGPSVASWLKISPAFSDLEAIPLFKDSAMDVPMAGPVFLQKFHSYNMNFMFISIDRENQ